LKIRHSSALNIQTRKPQQATTARLSYSAIYKKNVLNIRQIALWTEANSALSEPAWMVAKP